jgi:hypothetical protein
MGQMVVRIALQCNEADAYLIMDENNPAPRLLSRPGEGIYNDRAGAIEGNSPFQAVWLSEDERDARLREIRSLADEQQILQAPVVFEGNAPSEIADNQLLHRAIHSPSRIPSAEPRIWLGLPNAIKGPTEATFHQRAGSNLLVIGQRDETVLAILTIGLISLAAEHREGPLRFVLLDGSTPNAQPATLGAIVQSFPHEITVVKPGDSLAILHQLAEELHEERPAGEGKTFVLIHRLQNFRKLRMEDDFSMSMDNGDAANPPADLQTIVNEGPSRGMHVIATIDTYNNVMRWLGRKTLTEFNMRVLFQMSASDSASLCDDPKASMLGLHRALFVNEQQGYMETFRPYALPAAFWFEEAIQKLAARRMSQVQD